MTTKIWTAADIPPLDGKLILVTGATGGLGYEIALAVAKAGATIIVAGRNEEKGKIAVANIRKLSPKAKIEFGEVDLGSLTSVAEFAENVSRKYEVLDVLINNAGTAAPSRRETTKDGFEIVFGTNHLSHFALTAHLLPLLRKSQAPRVVTVTSGIYRQGNINFDDLQSEKCNYGMNVYSQSKLANILFALELQRKSDAGCWKIMSNAVNPGFSRTEGVNQMAGVAGWITNKIIKPFASHSAADGALSALYAATSPEATGGKYYGPNGLFEMKGVVTQLEIHDKAKNMDIAAKLWDISVNLTNARWP